MDAEEFYQEYMTKPLTIKKANEMIENILLEETGKPPEYFNTHSMVEIEAEIGIPHYNLKGPKDMKELQWHRRYRLTNRKLRWYRNHPPPPEFELDEEMLLNWDPNQ